MEDDTEYIILTEPDAIGGLILDQLLIAYWHKHRLKVYDEQRDLIEAARYRLVRSCVPEEFKIIELEIL